MRRREFITLLGGAAAAWPLAAQAQPVREKRLIGWLGGSSKQAAQVNLDAFLQGLRDFGHEDGRDVEIVYRWADGDISRLPKLAKDLVAAKPRVIVSAVQTAIRALADATASIPIVVALLVSPLGSGLADSYNHPGHNFTGVLMTLDSLPAKQAELLLRVIPHAATVGVLANPASAMGSIMLRNLEAGLRETQIKLLPLEAGTAAELDAAFETLKHQQVDGLIVLQDVLFFTEARHILKLVEAARLPAIHGFRQHVEQGGLMSYGVDIPQNFWRAAYFVDRILKGDKPGDLPIEVGDLPIEVPTKLELAVNLKTAKALGIEIPPTLLAVADEVIE